MQSDIRIDGRVFAYVFPCAWEDYAKMVSRDPLGRISALHRRWFEFFDLDAGALVEAESERDARDLELQLRSPFKAHRAGADDGPGQGWRPHRMVRGANHALSRGCRLGEQGYRCYPLKDGCEPRFACAWTGCTTGRRCSFPKRKACGSPVAPASARA
jgi:hypothetical protein